MSCFFAAVVPFFMLYSSLSQAAPMVPPNSEGQIVSTSEKAEIRVSAPQAQHPSTPVSPSSIPQIAIRQQLPPAPVPAPLAPLQPDPIPSAQVHCTPDMVQLQLPLCPQRVDIPPCPPDQPQQQDQPPQPPQPPKKKTGWKNGIMNVLKAINNFFVGENGCLTNLMTTTGKEYTEQRKKQAKEAKNKAPGKGRRFACCVVIKNDPSPSASQEEGTGEGEKKASPKFQMPSISLSWFKNRVSASVQPAGVPGAPDQVPGANTDHRTSTNSFSCCFTGEKLINIDGGIINSKIKNQITTCGCVVNASVVDN